MPRVLAVSLLALLLSACGPVPARSPDAGTGDLPASQQSAPTAPLPTQDTAATSRRTAPRRLPVTLDNPSGDVRCHYSQTVAEPQGLDVLAAPDAAAAVVAHLPQDWTVFGCTVSADQMWLGIVHEFGLPAIEECPDDDAHCAVSHQCALTVAQTTAGQVYAGPCHSGWIPVGHTFSLTD